MSVSFLPRSGRAALAYKKTEGGSSILPGVLFLHGLRSDMEGTKAAFLAQYCDQAGQALVRFDCTGHGKSEGNFESGTIGQWRQDALDVVDELTDGPLILVGSSMGGWLALLVALARPDRVCGLVGLAAAPDFTRAIKAGMNVPQKNDMERQGWFDLSGNADFPVPITRALLEEGERHCLLSGPIGIECPVRLIQGMKDTEVAWQTAHRIANAITSVDKQVYLRERGDHRLSSPDDLALLAETVKEISQNAKIISGACI